MFLTVITKSIFGGLGAGAFIYAKASMILETAKTGTDNITIVKYILYIGNP
jgi:hypothetical protein